MQRTPDDCLQALYDKYPYFSREDWDILERFATVKRIKKGASFLKAGKISRKSAFVLEGIFKMCLLDEDGNEKILKFCFSGDLLGNCDSFLKNQASLYNITAVEDAVIWSLNIPRFPDFYPGHPKFQQLHLQLYQEVVEQQTEHVYILSLKTPLQRYRFLLERRPAFIRKLSLTNIARYLFTSREALSRARLCLVDQARNFCD